MNRKELIRRLKLPEWDDFEAKEARKELPKDIWKTVSAFSNSDGGIIVLGVKETPHGALEISGVDNADKIQNDFVTGLRGGKFNIQLSSKGHLFNIGNKTVIAFRLPPMPRQARPVYYNDDIRNTYIRQAATNQRASKDEIGRMLREASEFSSDSMIIADTGLKDIDLETIRMYLRYLGMRNPEHPFVALKDEAFLEKCGVMKVGVLTMAGLLLFGSTDAILRHFSAYGLSIFRMSNATHDTVIDRRWDDRKIYEENLIRTYFAAMDYMKKHVAVPFMMSEDGVSRTENVPQVIAVREALVNLLVHRDYFDNGQAAIRIYDDRIIFRNPGAAPFSIEEIMGGCESVPRNPDIARVFRLPGWAEIAGSGMMKIFDNWQAAGYVPPVVRNNDPTHWFTVELHEKVLGTEDSTRKTTQKSTYKTTQKQQEIIDYLKGHPTAGRKEIAVAIGGITEDGVKKNLQVLKERGLLQRIGPAKGGHWEVVGMGGE